MGRLIDEHNEREKKNKPLLGQPKDHVGLPPKAEKVRNKYTQYEFWRKLIKGVIGK